MKVISILFFACTSLFGHTHYLKKKVLNQSIINEIPKVIHQIWVGSKPIPEAYKVYALTAQRLHPDWDYKLWTDADVEHFSWINKDLFDKAENPGMKSDIWRYEILYQFGGIYLDGDVECIRPFDPIQERLQFFAGICDKNSYLVNNGVIGSIPRSKILEDVIVKLKSNIMTQSIDTHSSEFTKVLDSTGPNFFTKIILENSDFFKDPRNIIFPYPYFQPTDHHHFGVPQNAKEVYNLKNICIANHRNGCSWISDEDLLLLGIKK
jgi:mannosyltransferase OCH1-like enzyme